MVHLQPAQGVLELATQVLGAAVEPAWVTGGQQRALGGQEDLVAPALQGLPDDLLVPPAAVQGRRVQVVHAGVEG